MVEDKFKQAEAFWHRAERLRQIARDLTLTAERDLLLKCADEYEEMARSAAAVATSAVAPTLGGGEATGD